MCAVSCYFLSFFVRSPAYATQKVLANGSLDPATILVSVAIAVIGYCTAKPSAQSCANVAAMNANIQVLANKTGTILPAVPPVAK